MARPLRITFAYRALSVLNETITALGETNPAGYGAWSPDVPGCVALGDTEAEALSEMKDAIQLHLEVMREREEPLPTPSTISATTVDAA